MIGTTRDTTFIRSAMACALAAAGMAAHAQSNVTIYGIIDSTVEAASAKGATAAGKDVPQLWRENSNSSLIGFKGTEDLGGGMSAMFQIEYGLNVDQGTGGAPNRDTFVGLAGGFGSVKMGFLTSPMRGLGGKLNWIPGSTSIANNIGIFTTLNGQALGLNSRIPNAVIYNSPKVSGFEGALMYSFAESKPAKNDSAFGLGLTMDRDPFWVGYAYEARKDRGVLAAMPSTDWEHRLAVRYTWGDTKFSLGFDRHGSDGTYGTGAGAGNGTTQRDAFGLAVSHTVGLHEFIGHVVRANNLKCSGAATTGQCAAANVSETNASQWALVYHYWLSKRTMLQAFATRITNARNAKYDFDVNPVTADYATRPAGADPTGVGFGIRHAF
ncbi:porin [Piscinibacter terrae]|nr:porin [Albitalea terrae]